MDATNGVDELVEHDPTQGSHVEHGVVEHPNADGFGDLRGLIEKLDYPKWRGIRIITDLVMNHTSDSHPWFQEETA
jgi:maltose alpha-D-glucosyltransferase/alpha-amylase